jgi:hypothetical protein
MDERDRRLLDERHQDTIRRVAALEDFATGMRELATGMGHLADQIETCQKDTSYLREKVDARDTQRETDRRADRRALWAVCGTIIAAMIGAAVVLVIAFS